MKVLMKIVMVGLVLVVVGLMYMVIIGTAIYIPDFTQDDDGDGEADIIDTAQTIAYATFEIKTSCSLYDTTKVDGYVLSIASSVSPYTSPDDGLVIIRDTWGILSPVPPSPYETLGKYWIKVMITGPDGYSSEWTSAENPLLASLDYPQVPSYTIWGTGRTFFSASGDYTCKATQYAVLFAQDVITEEGTKTVGFTVPEYYGG